MLSDDVPVPQASTNGDCGAADEASTEGSIQALVGNGAAKRPTNGGHRRPTAIRIVATT